MKIIKPLLVKYFYHVLILSILIFLFCFIWKIGIKIPSSYTDASFHLATAKGYLRAGGVTAWDFWESLPIGRPNNYPPAFHLVLATLLNFGLSPSVGIKIMMELSVVGGFFAYAWSLTKLFSVKVAFWTTFLLALSFHFVQLSSTVMPATMVVFLSPALLYFSTRKKWLSYCALLTLMLYLHMFLPYFILFSLAIYFLIFRRKQILTLISYSAAAIIFYSPWLFHICSHGLSYIKYFDPSTAQDMFNEVILLNLVIIILAISGTVYLFKKIKLVANEYFFFLIAALLVLCPSFIIASRLIDGHFLVFSAVLATIAIEQLYKRRSRWAVFLLTLSYLWFTPILAFRHNLSVKTNQSTFNNYLNFNPEYSKEFEEKYFELIGTINRKIKPGDTLATILTSFDGDFVDKNYSLTISNLFSAYTGSATLNLRQPEIYHRDSPDITKSKFILSNIPVDELSNNYLTILGYNNTDPTVEYAKNNFQNIFNFSYEDESPIYCYYNKSTDTIKEIIPSSKFPIFLGDGLILLLIVIICLDNRNKKNEA